MYATSEHGILTNQKETHIQQHMKGRQQNREHRARGLSGLVTISLRMGGQGCVLPPFSPLTRAHGPTDGQSLF